MTAFVVPQAELGGRESGASIVEVIAGTRMPRLPGAERYVKNDTAVGELRLRVEVNKLENHTSVKVAVHVGGVQLAALVVPATLRIAAPHGLVASNLEDIGEI